MRHLADTHARALVQILVAQLLHHHLWETTISVRLKLVIHFGMAQAVQLASAVRSTLHRGLIDSFQAQQLTVLRCVYVQMKAPMMKMHQLE